MAACPRECSPVFSCFLSSILFEAGSQKRKSFPTHILVALPFHSDSSYFSFHLDSIWSPSRGSRAGSRTEEDLRDGMDSRSSVSWDHITVAVDPSGGLGPVDSGCALLVSIYFQAWLGGLPWFKRDMATVSFSLMCRSLPAQSDPFCCSFHVYFSCSSYSPVSYTPVMHLSPRWLSNPQDAAAFRTCDPTPGEAYGNAFCQVGFYHLRAGYFIHALFCTGHLTANFWAFEGYKKWKIKIQTINCTWLLTTLVEGFVRKALIVKGSLNNYSGLLLIPTFLLTWFVWLLPIPDRKRKVKGKPDVGEPRYSTWLYQMCTGHTATCVTVSWVLGQLPVNWELDESLHSCAVHSFVR